VAAKVSTVSIHLIEQYGIDTKLFDGQAGNLNNQCGARCPDLSKVV